jgi:hypothetical protein
MVPFIRVEKENNAIYILGLYPLDFKHVKRNLEFEFEKLASLSDQPIIISHPREPTLFLDSARQTNIFEFLHSLLDRTGFKQDLYFRSANVDASECYDRWCTQHNISKRLIINRASPKHYLNAITSANYKISEHSTKDKILSLLIGTPRLQKILVTEWYLKNISLTDLENKVVSSFILDNYQADHWSDELKDKVKSLPGNFKDNSQVRPKRMFWDSEYSNAFNAQFSRSLFNFSVDYVEFEDFDNYHTYQTFKQQHPWWREDMISEKTLMCCLFKQPFIRLGMQNSLKKFQNWGFRTYDGILFDESYDNIENFYTRADHIFSQVMHYLNMSFEDVHSKIYSPQVQEVVEHNYNLALDILKSDKYVYS